MRVIKYVCIKTLDCLCTHTCHTYDGLLQHQADHLQTDPLQLLSDLTHAKKSYKHRITYYSGKSRTHFL